MNESHPHHISRGKRFFLIAIILAVVVVGMHF